MKRIIQLIILLSLAQLSVANTEKKVTTEIKEVTVYQQNALVKRQGKTTVPAGNSAIVISELNQSIRPQDVRVSAKGDFTVLSITYRYDVDTISGVDGEKQRAEISESIATLQQRINRENGFLDIYNKEEQMLLANQNFTHSVEGVNIERLEKASVFLRNRLFDIKQKRLEIQDLVASLQKQINDLYTEQGKIKGLVKNTTLEMIVRVSAKVQTKGTFILDYRVHNAGWAPSYDATVEKVTDPLMLEYKAKVYQNTGEDWENVVLTIATGNPNINKKKPNLLPWYISGVKPQPIQNNSNQDWNAYLRSQPYNPNVRTVSGQVLDNTGETIPFANIVVHGHPNSGTTTDFDGYYKIDIPNNGSQLHFSFVGYNNEYLNVSSSVMNVILKSDVLLSEAVVITSDKASANMFGLFDGRKDVEYEMADEDVEYFERDATDFAEVSVAYSMTNTKFKIDAIYDIPSDGKEYAVQIQEYEMDADYIYQCTPKLDPTAYLTAQITGWEDYNLLSGVMNIYFEDAFIGASQLDLSNAEDTLSLSLGEDKGIQVTRKRIKAENKKQILGGHKSVIREWEYTVRNNKREAVKIRIDDQLPLSNTEEIEIKAESTSGGKLNDLTGKVIWEYDLAPAKKKSFNFKYSVKYPKNMYLRL